MPTPLARPRPSAPTDRGLPVRVLSAVLATAAVLLGVTVAAHADETARVLDQGEVTAFDWAFHDGAPVLELSHGGMRYAPEQVLLRARGDVAGLTLPDRLPPGYEGVADPGSTVYQLPGTETAGLPSIGWSTERLGTVAAPDGAAVEPGATLRIDVAGPGRVVAFTDAGDGVLVRHVDTLRSSAADIEMPPRATVRPTWLFEEPGTYVLAAQPSLTLPDGSTRAGAPTSYRIEVTEAPPPKDVPSPGPAEPVRPVDPTDPVDAPDPSEPAGPAPAALSAAETACSIPGLARDAVSLTDGHFDYGVQVRDGALDPRIKDDRTSPPTWRNPDSVLFLLGQTARKQVPAAPGFGFLGDAGDSIWTIGQTQEDGVPWLGWNTQHPTAVSDIDGPTTWQLDSVEGPGELFVYQTGAFGSVTRLLGLAEGWPRSLPITSNTHVHANWSFTAPGVYRVTTTHRATLTSGPTVSSTDTLFFQVGPCGDGGGRPSAPLRDGVLLADARLTPGNRSGVVARPATVAPGGTVSLDVGSQQPGAWLMPVAYSTPRQLGWQQVTPTRQLVEVTIPRTLDAGRHKVAVYEEAGLVGWAPVRVTDPAEADPDPAPDDSAPDEDPPSTNRPSRPSTTTGLTGTPLTTESSCLPSPGETAPAPGDDNTDPGTGDGARSSVTSGHLDFGAQIDDGGLVARVKDDRSQPPSWVDPASLLFVLGDAARQQVPDGAAYSFLGDAGDPIWLMPQTQVAALPWLGWNTQDPTLRESVQGSVRFTLDSVSGPGRLAVYLTDSFGGVGEKTFGNAPGFPSSFDVPLNVHAHGNWAFTEPGDYLVTMTQSATLTDGRTVSDQATLSFRIGDTAGRNAPAHSRSGAATSATLALPTLALPRVAEDETSDNADATLAETESEVDAGTCLLPNTGADEHLAGLLQLGLSLTAMGGFLLAVARRAGTARPRRA